MSGGAFDYNQYKIGEIADHIQSVIDNNNKPVEKQDRWGDWDNREVYSSYSEETIMEFKRCVSLLREAMIYVHRIDWLLSDDDGEETFHKRLKEELFKNKTP